MKKKIKSDYEIVNKLTYLTNQCIKSNNFKRAKKIITIAEVAFRVGNNSIKSLLTNVYVHSVSIHLEILNKPVHTFFPSSLLQSYHQQIKSSSL